MHFAHGTQRPRTVQEVLRPRHRRLSNPVSPVAREVLCSDAHGQKEYAPIS